MLELVYILPTRICELASGAAELPGGVRVCSPAATPTGMVSVKTMMNSEFGSPFILDYRGAWIQQHSLKELPARPLLRLSRYSVRKRVRPHVRAHLRNARRPSPRAATRLRLDAYHTLGLAFSRVAVPGRRARLRSPLRRRRPRS